MWFITFFIILVAVIQNVTCRMFILSRREDTIPQNNIVRVDNGYSNSHYVTKENPIKTIVYPNHWEIQRPRPFSKNINYDSNVEPSTKTYKNENHLINFVNHHPKANDQSNTNEWTPTKTPVYHHHQQQILPVASKIPINYQHQTPMVFEEQQFGQIQEPQKFSIVSPQNFQHENHPNLLAFKPQNHVFFSPGNQIHPPNFPSYIHPVSNDYQNFPIFNDVIPSTYKLLNFPQEPQSIPDNHYSPDPVKTQIFQSNYQQDESLSKNPIVVQDIPQYNNFAPSSVEVIRSISYQLPTQIGTGLLNMGGNNIYLKPISEKIYIKPMSSPLVWQNNRQMHYNSPNLGNVPMLIYKGYQGPEGRDQLPSQSQYHRRNRHPIMFDSSAEATNNIDSKEENINRKVHKKDLAKVVVDVNQKSVASEGGDLKLQLNKNSSFPNIENPPTIKPKFVQKQKRHIYGERIHIIE